MRLAPDFALPDADGIIHRLSDYAGRWLVVYFYPKDNTPACTAEACGFRDMREAIAELSGAAIVGISKDTVRSHKRFIQKHRLNFTLLSDPEHKVIEAYGAWAPRTFMGRKFIGTHRNTYIVSPDGRIAKEYKDINPKMHAAEILADLKKLQGAG